MCAPIIYMDGLDSIVCVCIMRVMVVFKYFHMWYVYFAMMVLSTKNEDRSIYGTVAKKT